MVAGSKNGYHRTVELYSPNGKCHHSLANLPSGAMDPVLAFVDNKILSCAGQNDICYQYHLSNNTWSVYATAPVKFSTTVGITFEEKLYLIDGMGHSEIFDPVANSWSTWEKPENISGYGSCIVHWNNKFLFLGGWTYPRRVQTYNPVSGEWELIDSDLVPMDMKMSGCAMLPSGDVLIVGSMEGSYDRSVAVYNPESNTWKKLDDATYDRHGAVVVVLGSRVFAIDGRGGNHVEEFDYNGYTWDSVSAGLITHREESIGVMALPAEMFNLLPGACTGVE